MSDAHSKAMTTVDRSAVAVMHPLVSAAMAHNPTPETLRELMQLQREWEAGEAKKSFVHDMLELKRALPVVLHRDKHVFFQSKRGGADTDYRHTTLAAAMEAVSGPLNDNHFTISWLPATTDRTVSVTCRITHRDGHTQESTMESPPDTSGNKGAAQARMSTVTLLERYTLLALLGIATADMKDPAGEQAPPPPKEPNAVDQAKNVTAAAWARKQGMPPEVLAPLLGGRGIRDWTAADLVEIKILVAERNAPPPASEPAPDPHSDPSPEEYFKSDDQ